MIPNRMVEWSELDNRVIYATLKSMGIPVYDRWPTTYACDFYRKHGPAYVTTRSEATAAIQRIAREEGISSDYLFGLFALGYMVGTGLNPDFAVAVSIATSPIVREPFELLAQSQLSFSTFWKPIDQIT
jgi:hypothetical protein